jgi:transcriptional regulator, lacI family
MSTIRDVARRAGVSIATVSRILNNDEYFGVTAETKRRVLEAVKELNYKKKNTKRKSTQLNISIIKSFDERIESEDPYFVSLRLDLEYALKKKGIKSKVFELQTFEKNEEILMNFIISSAIVVIGEIKRSQLDFLKSLNDNIICVDAYNFDNSIDYIKFDMKHSVKIVIDYLTKLGHKKIGLLGGKNQIVRNLVDFREQYFIEIMKEYELYDEKFVKVDEFSAESGYKMMREMLKLKERPTAVFCTNDSIAMGAYKAVRERKLKIFDDISIIGFNDLKISQYMNPPLTTLRIDTRIIAEETINVLVELIEHNRSYRKKVYLPVELIERESCGSI